MSNKIKHLRPNQIRIYRIDVYSGSEWFRALHNAYENTITVTGSVEQIKKMITELKAGKVKIIRILSKPDVAWRYDNEKFGIGVKYIPCDVKKGKKRVKTSNFSNQKGAKHEKCKRHRKRH